MSISNNIVGLPITLSEMATLLTESNILKNVCLSTKINKWSAIKPVDLNRVDHATFAGVSDINCGLVPQAINPNINGRIVSKPTFTAWTYQRPQGGSSSPFRLGDFCVYDGTTQKGYRHDAQVFLETQGCDLDVENGQATVMPLKFLMNGSRYPANSTTEKINIDLKDLSLDYKSTADQGPKIPETNRRITCGYWRFGVVVIIPLYTQDSTGADVRNGTGAYLCLAKDTISTAIISNILTQSVRFSYGSDNALKMMKRAMLYSDTNTSFEALPVLAFNASLNEDTGVWTATKLLTYPDTGYVNLRMTNMITAKMTLASHALIVNGTTITPVANYGFVVTKAMAAALTTSSTVISAIGVTRTIPNGDTWTSPNADIAGSGCSFTESTSSSVVTFRITWTAQLITKLKTAVSAASVGSVVSVGTARITYLSDLKGANVKLDVNIPIYVAS